MVPRRLRGDGLHAVSAWAGDGRERQVLDRSKEPIGENPAAEEPRGEASGFRKESVRKEDGRYIIFYSFHEDEA